MDFCDHVQYKLSKTSLELDKQWETWLSEVCSLEDSRNLSKDSFVG